MYKQDRVHQKPSDCCTLCGLFLSHQSTKIKRGTKGDTSMLQPTLMAAVPVRTPTQQTHYLNGKLGTFQSAFEARSFPDT